MKKPDSCRACPWYGDGEGYCPDEVPPRAEVIFVCQNPGETEEVQARPLVGMTGQILRHQFVARHLTGHKMGYANIVKCRRQVEGRRSNDLPPIHTQEWREIVTYCRPALDESLARAPEAIVVLMGEHAVAARTDLLARRGKKPKMLHLRGTFIADQ